MIMILDLLFVPLITGLVCAFINNKRIIEILNIAGF